MELTKEQAKQIRDQIKAIKKTPVTSANGIEFAQINSLSNKYDPNYIVQYKQAKLGQIKNNLINFVNNQGAELANYDGLRQTALAAARDLAAALSDDMINNTTVQPFVYVSYSKHARISNLRQLIAIQVVSYLQRQAQTAFTKEYNLKTNKKEKYNPPTMVGGGDGKMSVGLKFEDQGVDELFTSSKKKGGKKSYARFFSTTIITTSDVLRSFYSKAFRVGVAPLLKLKIIPTPILCGCTFAFKDIYDQSGTAAPFIGKFTFSKSKMRLSLTKKSPNVFEEDYHLSTMSMLTNSPGLDQIVRAGQSVNGPQFQGGEKVKSVQQQIV